MADPDPRSVVVVAQVDELKKLLGAPAAPVEAAADKTSTTEHAAEVGGVRFPYQAVAGTIPVKLEDADKPKAKMFFVAYTRTDVADLAERPITFCFNGGPGSASIWLHMGVLGPYRVRLDVGQLPAPGAVAEPNALSLLDRTDLVFVDPVATGFSRPDSGKGAEYHGVEGDVEAMADFVRRYVTRHGRWGSPKFLAGESYGTTRAAGLARLLQEKHGMEMTGLILVSLALKFQTLKFDAGNDLPYVLYVSAYAATAAYHGRVQVPDLDRHLALAEAWAFDRYMPALLRGSSLPQADQDQLATELGAWIGLRPEYVRRCNNRVDLGRFCAELLREERRTVGRLDARFTGRGLDAAGERLEIDPSFTAVLGAFTSAFHHHARARLGWEEDEAYRVLNFEVNAGWTWDNPNQYLDVTADLRHVLVENPHLRVFVASGRYDLATPPAASDYTLNQLGLEPDRIGAVRHHVYPAGHMMYLHEPSLLALRQDLVAFLSECAGDGRRAAG